MKFDLRNNAFYLLGVAPEAASADIADAFDDAVMDSPDDESKLQIAKDVLATPKKRLREELSSLWDVHPGEWDKWLASTPDSWDGIFGIARINLAAHFLSALGDDDYSDDIRRKALDYLMGGRDGFDRLLPALVAARKTAGMPPPSAEHFRQAMHDIGEQHCKVAMRAIETASAPCAMMTSIAEEMRYDKTASGRFAADLVRAFDRWSITKLRPIEDGIDKAIASLRGGEVNKVVLDDIDRLLNEWDEYSQPMQLMNEAKGLDEERSKKLANKLRSAAVYIANEHEEHEAALHISNVLNRTFPELPGIAGTLATDITTLRGVLARQANRKEREQVDELVEMINEIKEVPSSFSSHSARFERLAPLVLKRLSKNENVWRFIRLAAIEIFNEGYSNHGRIMAKLLSQWANEYGASQDVREKLHEDLKHMKQQQKLADAHSRLKRAIEKKDVTAAVSAAKSVAAMTDDASEKKALRDFINKHEDEHDGDWNWVGWVIGGGILLWILLSR